MKTSLGRILFLICCCFTTSSFAEFTLVANHPEARAWYPSGDGGRHIKVLRTFQDRVYMGFGQDDGAPIGGSFLPLPIRYIDQIDQMSGPQGVLESQQMSVMEVMQGNLFIPSIDVEGTHPRDHYSKCLASVCYPGAFPTSTGFVHHVFAAAEYNGSIYMVGSSASSPCLGTVWKSSDGGDNWVVERTMAKDNNYPGCARLNFIGVVNNKLYIQGYQYDNNHTQTGEGPCDPAGVPSVVCNWNVRPDVHIFDGASWSTSLTNPLITGRTAYSNARLFKQELVYRNAYRSSNGFNRYTLKTFDGTTVRTIRDEGFLFPFTVTDEWFYMLDASNKIVRSKDLVSWRDFDTVPSNITPTSMTVANNALYIGTSEGQVYKSIIPEPTEFNFIEYKKYLIPVPKQ